jgi:hypothetical protein
MGELKTTTQKPGGATTGLTPEGDPGEHNQGAEFGAGEQATRGSDRDLDRSGRSANQRHGHPREERSEQGGA